MAEQFLDGSKPLPIAHYKPDLGGRSVDDLIAEALHRIRRPRLEAIDLMASLIRVEGMFNVNSTSVEAWKALLASLLGEDIVTRDEGGQLSRTAVAEGVPVAGLMAPMDLTAEGRGAVAVQGTRSSGSAAGCSTEEEITLLAEAIVREVRKRGPFLSLADFVNRRVGSDPGPRAGRCHPERARLGGGVRSTKPTTRATGR